MSKIRNDIKKFADKEDQPVLTWLFDNYHWSSQWYFVATCTFERYGVRSYETNRVWKPTKEGRCLYNNKEQLV